MANVARDEAREYRIAMEAIVDAYDAEEQALGWYYHLEEKMAFPFQATCTQERRTSPLRLGQTVEVMGMAPEAECAHEMFVDITWQKRTLSVPLRQLTGLDVDDDTQEAIEDWRYWLDRGYQL